MTENKDRKNIAGASVKQGSQIGVLEFDAMEHLPSSEAIVGVGAASHLSVIRPKDGVQIVKNVLRKHPHSIRRARVFGVLPGSRELIDPNGTYVRIQDPEEIDMPTAELESFSETKDIQALSAPGQRGVSRVKRVLVEILTGSSVEALGLGDIFKNNDKPTDNKVQLLNNVKVEDQDLAA